MDADASNGAKTDGQKLALKLADTYIHCQRADKAEAIYKQVLGGDSLLGRPSKAVEGYCLMQLALAYSNEQVNRNASIDCYRRFYSKEYANLPWAATAILRLGVLEYNSTQDPHCSIRHYQYVIAKYPNHPEAERACISLRSMLSSWATKHLPRQVARSTSRDTLSMVGIIPAGETIFRPY